MPIMNNMRITHNLLEIVGLLKEIMLENNNVTLWQKSGGNKRVVHAGKVSEISVKGRFIKIEPLEDDEPFYFNKNLTLYMHGTKHTILFKTKNRHMKGGKLILPFPDEATVAEKRSDSRIKIDEDRVQDIVLVLEKNSIDYLGTLAPKVTDISLTGVGLRVNGKVSDHLVEGLEVHITQICGYVPIPAIAGKIQYIQEDYTKKKKRSCYYRIGIKFKDPLDDITLTTIFDMSK